VLVTGSSRGIGAGVARYLASCGAKVAVTYASSASQAEEVYASLSGDGHLIFPLVVNDSASVDEAFNRIMETWGGLEGLVNNAGITKDQLLLRMKPEEMEAVLQTNLMGTFLCTKAAVKIMLKQRQGSIVNITSVIGQTGNAGQSNYAASKAGIEAFSKSVAQEVGSRGIRVNCVAPGFISTEMTAALSAAHKEDILKKVPLGFLGEVDDVASPVGYLLSEQSRYITGQTISVNGGLNM
jgi:3-oxoacyl-[acyl-carrier protein] reductase